MFEELRRAWREAVENFRRELHADDPAGADRGTALARELDAAREALRRLEDEMHRTRREIEEERHQEQVCRRREGLARQIQDLETVRIAVEFAERHRERAQVLSNKLAAFQAEHALRVRELRELEEIASRRGLGFDPPQPDSSRPDPLVNGSPNMVEFERMRREARERAAADRLEELKRQMRT